MTRHKIPIKVVDYHWKSLDEPDLREQSLLSDFDIHPRSMADQSVKHFLHCLFAPAGR